MAVQNKKNTPVKDINYYQKKFWKLFFYSIGGIFLFFIFASWGLFGKMPSFEDFVIKEESSISNQ